MTDAGVLFGIFAFVLIIVIFAVIAVVTSVAATVGAIAVEEDNLLEEE